MNGFQDRGTVHQVVFRWDGNHGRQGTGMSAVAHSCSPERAERLGQELGRLLWVSGAAAARPSVVRTLSSDGDVMLVQRWPTTDRGGRPSTVSHVLFGDPRVLMTRQCLGLAHRGWGSQQKAEQAKGPQSVIDCAELDELALRRLPGMLDALPGVQNALILATAELLRDPDQRVSLLLEDRPPRDWPDADRVPLVYLGLFLIFHSWLRQEWTFATYDTVDTHPLRLMAVPRWEPDTGGSGPLARVMGRRPARPGVEHWAASRLVEHLLANPDAPAGVPQLVDGLADGAALDWERRRARLRDVLGAGRPPARPRHQPAPPHDPGPAPESGPVRDPGPAHAPGPGRDPGPGRGAGPVRDSGPAHAPGPGRDPGPGRGAGPVRDSGPAHAPGPGRDPGPGRGAGPVREPGSAHAPGPVRDPGSAHAPDAVRDTGPGRGAGPVRDSGPAHAPDPARDTGPVHPAGPVRDPGPAYAPDPVRDPRPLHAPDPVREPSSDEPAPWREPHPPREPASWREPAPAQEPDARREPQPSREPASRGPMPPREPAPSREPVPPRGPEFRPAGPPGSPPRGPRAPEQVAPPRPVQAPGSAPAPGYPSTPGPEQAAPAASTEYGTNRPPALSLPDGFDTAPAAATDVGDTGALHREPRGHRYPTAEIGRRSDEVLLDELRSDRLSPDALDAVLTELGRPDRVRARRPETRHALCAEVLKRNLYFAPQEAGAEPALSRTAMAERAARVFHWAVAPLVRDERYLPDLRELFYRMSRDRHATTGNWLWQTFVEPEHGQAPDLPPVLWSQLLRDTFRSGAVSAVPPPPPTARPSTARPAHRAPSGTVESPEGTGPPSSARDRFADLTSNPGCVIGGFLGLIAVMIALVLILV
ncbi:hypothetical protein [Streptomyces sp. NPDC003720]|uniref:hypothetical protein n=1 Tax=Streptomyces sp. NPDC003720 TaxID=3364684 RepID=UPI0036C97CAA